MKLEWKERKVIKSKPPVIDVKAQDHYTQFVIQPAEFIAANDLDYFQGNVIKYVCRHKRKNGIQDLEKAQHYLEMLIEKFKTGKVDLSMHRPKER